MHLHCDIAFFFSHMFFFCLTFHFTSCILYRTFAHFKSHLLFFALLFFILLCSSSYFLFLVLIFYVFDVCKFFLGCFFVFFCNYLSTCLYFLCPYFRTYFFFLSIWGFSWISCPYFYITPISTSQLLLLEPSFCVAFTSQLLFLTYIALFFSQFFMLFKSLHFF